MWAAAHTSTLSTPRASAHLEPQHTSSLSTPDTSSLSVCAHLRAPRLADVAGQLRSAGVLAAVRIARLAFPTRLPHRDVVTRFGFFAHKTIGGPSVDGSDGDASALDETELAEADGARALSELRSRCAAVLGALLDDDQPAVDDGDGGATGAAEAAPVAAAAAAAATGGGGAAITSRYVLGKTRAFFRAGVLETLERQRSAALACRAVALQRHARGRLCALRYARVRELVLVLQAVVRRRRARAQYLASQRWAITHQAAWRMVRARRLVTRSLASRRLQAFARMHRHAARLHALRRAVATAQRWRRGQVARRAASAEREERARAADVSRQLAGLRRQLEEESGASPSPCIPLAGRVDGGAR